MLAYLSTGFFSTLAYRIVCVRENRRRDRGERNEVILNDSDKVEPGHEKNGVFDSVEAAKEEKGDEWSGFRYRL